MLIWPTAMPLDYPIHMHAQIGQPYMYRQWEEERNPLPESGSDLSVEKTEGSSVEISMPNPLVGPHPH